VALGARRAQVENVTWSSAAFPPGCGLSRQCDEFSGVVASEEMVSRLPCTATIGRATARAPAPGAHFESMPRPALLVIQQIPPVSVSAFRETNHRHLAFRLVIDLFIHGQRAGTQLPIRQYPAATIKI